MREKNNHGSFGVSMNVLDVKIGLKLRYHGFVVPKKQSMTGAASLEHNIVSYIPAMF